MDPVFLHFSDQKWEVVLVLPYGMILFCLPHSGLVHLHYSSQHLCNSLQRLSMQFVNLSISLVVSRTCRMPKSTCEANAFWFGFCAQVFLGHVFQDHLGCHINLCAFSFVDILINSIFGFCGQHRRALAKTVRHGKHYIWPRCCRTAAGWVKQFHLLLCVISTSVSSCACLH